MNMPLKAQESKTSENKVISLGQALNGHNNALGLIRLLLASLVIVDHAFPLGGFGKDPFWYATHGQASLGSLAVAGFFAISGYLIAKSGMSGDVVQFMWKRTLRIFPAYWAVLLFTAFIVAPLLWLAAGGTLPSYFSGTGNGVGASPYFFITGNWTLNIGTYGIYDLLVNTTPYGQEIHGSALNGSIWTLIYEWQCYLLIGVLVLFAVMKNAKIIVPFLAVTYLFAQVAITFGWQPITAVLPSFLSDPFTASLGFTFLMGSVFAVYSRQVPFDGRLGLISLIVMGVSMRVGGFTTIGTAAGAYFVLFLAAWLPQKTHWIGQKNDYSYGIYIYGFLVEQVLAYLMVYKLGFIPFVIISWAVTFGLAWLSWHVVEKRAMSLKDWGPGKGVNYWYQRTRFDRVVSRLRSSK